MSVVENAKEELLSSGAWSVDPAHSTIEFRVKHMMIQTVRGRFRDFDGAILSGDEPSISGSIRVASLETLQEDRDAHLCSADFFDAEQYPEIVFEAAEMQFNGDDRHFGLAGDLTKLCAASGVSATVDVARVPLSAAAAGLVARKAVCVETLLAGGDDYEVLCTVPPAQSEALVAAGQAAGLAVTVIGTIVASHERPRFLDGQGQELTLKRLSYSHF